MRRQGICPDCGGTTKIIGDCDDYQIICNHCDPRGPVVIFDLREEEQKMYNKSEEPSTE